jgi:hypothetical protein
VPQVARLSPRLLVHASNPCRALACDLISLTLPTGTLLTLSLVVHTAMHLDLSSASATGVQMSCRLRGCLVAGGACMCTAVLLPKRYPSNTIPLHF